MSTKQPEKGYYKYPNELLHERLAETHDRVVQLEAEGAINKAEFARMKGEIESLQGLLTKGYDPSFIESHIKAIENSLANHEVRISGLEAGFAVIESETARAHARIADVESVVAEDRKVTRSTTRRVTDIEDQLAQGFPYIGAIFAVVIGVVSGWLWHRYDFFSSIKQTGGDVIVTATSAADLLICAILFGIGVAFAVMALVALFGFARHRARVEEESLQADAQDVFSRRQNPAEPIEGERPAFLIDEATEVMPAARVVAHS